MRCSSRGGMCLRPTVRATSGGAVHRVAAAFVVRAKGTLVTDLVRLPLEGGGAILLENAEAASWAEGPVKAGRVGDALRELPRTLQESLAPVRETAKAVLDQFEQAGSQSVEVEFGVNLSAKAGVVITSGAAAVHLTVRVTRGSAGDGPGVPADGARD